MRKIGELQTQNIRFEICFDKSDKHGNYYKLYRKWYAGGWHRNLIAKYADLASVTTQINDYVLLGGGY